MQEHRASNPPIAASFRLDQQLRQTYAPRSYCTQFDEDDLSFMHRVLASARSLTSSNNTSVCVGVPWSSAKTNV
ncbi:phage late control D family protein [Xanthomonas oryzae]|uniref:phage late control D family protein n=1 Tax=Xanthomonas oryzae TaxID=347 RepID=UPI0021169142|nr:phage late control D family protein [Xanthomonas oryzae]